MKGFTAESTIATVANASRWTPSVTNHAVIGGSGRRVPVKICGGGVIMEVAKEVAKREVAQREVAKREVAQREVDGVVA
ncbi:hypothetical protein CS0771_77020 [Catellatospora sp. IY07-71]|nr:hypothetical protein CS0771_77020 [Catellatospora sp. IY07-71]